MYIASAYPNNDMSALSMTVMAVVVAISLAAWLGMVFLADRQSPRRTAEIGHREAEEHLDAKHGDVAA